MIDSRPSNLGEYKIKASILLKSLRSTDPRKTLDAATRFKRLPHLADLSPQAISASKDAIKLKHALTVIALENKQPSWADFKRVLEKRETLRNNRAHTPLYPRRCAGFLNEWHADHDTARRHREQTGGYLLPFRNQFFICTEDYIKTLGLDPNDPDWERIGWDWAKPADAEAWRRLDAKLQAVEVKGGNFQ